MLRNSAYADGGPHSRVCSRDTPAQPPHQHERKFSGACLCRIALNHLPQLLRTHFKSFRKFPKFQKKNLQNLKTPPSGARGGPQYIWGVSIPFFISFLRYSLNIGLCNQSGPLLLLSPTSHC